MFIPPLKFFAKLEINFVIRKKNNTFALQNIKKDIVMKKIMRFLVCLLAPVMFFGCEEVQDMVGEMNITIAEEQVKIPDALFTQIEGVTTIVGTNVKESVAIAFKGDGVGTYTLGLGTDLLSAAANLSNISSMENTLVYIPSSGISEDGMTTLCGTLEITKYTSQKVEGTFTGYGIKTSIVSEGNLSWDALQESIKEISGSFKAVGQKL